MNDVFKKNINALKKFNPEIAKHIEGSESIPEIVSTHPNILIKYKGGVLPIHDIEDPAKKAFDMANSYPLLKNDLTIVIGCGGGFFIHSLTKKKHKEHFVLVVEPIPYFLKLLFEKYNLEKQILNSTLFFLTNLEYIGGALSVLETAFVIENYQTVISDYIFMLPDYYSKAPEKVITSLNQVRCNTGTAMGAGLQMALNDISNLPYIIRHRGVSDLKDVFKDKPCVCVNTGPSLKKNLWRLKELEGKVIIIAVAQALRTLIGYGITPDFITTVDFGEVNYEHFKGIMDSEVPLVCLNRTYAKILKEYKGPKFIVANQANETDESSTGVIGKKGTLEQGGSVSHFSFGLALSMGCNPITLIGQDLAYGEENKSHTDTADASGKIVVSEKGEILWRVTDPRSTLCTDKDLSMGPAQYTLGYFGGMVLTNIGLLSFITAYAQIIKCFLDRKIFNSTEGGANIRGAKRISLKSFIETYCNNDIDKTIIKPLLTLDDKEKELIKDSIPKLKMDIKNLEQLQKNCNKGLETTKEMTKLSKDKKSMKENKGKINKLLDLNHKYSDKANELARNNLLVTIGIYNESRAIAGRDLKVKGPKNGNLVKFENMETRLKRNKLILEATNKTVDKLLPEYKNSLQIFEEYISTGGEALFVDENIYEPSVKDSEKFISSGNWATPLIDARKLNDTEIINTCEELREKEIKVAQEIEDNTNLIEYLEIVSDVQDLGFGKKQIDKELLPKLITSLEKAKILQPQKMEARWGLATCYNHLEKFEEALKEYESLVKDFPDFSRLQFELGIVMLNIDKENGIKKIQEVMQKTKEFDHFLGSIGDLYMLSKNYTLAKDSYFLYLEKFPNDLNVIKALIKCCTELNDNENIIKYNKLSSKLEGPLY